MLKEKELKTQAAGSYAWAAAADAGRYSDECRLLYTPKQRSQAETFKDIVELAYSSENVFMNFRKKFVAIKLERPVVRDRRIIKELEKLCEERGYGKVVTAQGTTYRIPRI